MKAFNTVFYLIVFFAFFLPTNSNYYLQLPGFYLTISEVFFLLLPLINLLCYSEDRVYLKDSRLKILIFLLIVIVISTEFIIKPIIFVQSFKEALNSFKVGLPLFSSFILLFQGVRSDINKFWKVLLLAISSSVILSILSLFLYLPIYNDIEISGSVFEAFEGRIFNSNASFGFVGLFLIFKNKNKWFNRGLYVKVAIIAGVFSTFITFTRTYLGLSVLALVYLFFDTKTYKRFLKPLIVIVLFSITIALAYKNNETLKVQIDSRILETVFNATEIYQRTIENNRDVIYNGVKRRIIQGFWLIGLPYSKEIFISDKTYYRDEIVFFKTDTSVFNLLLRYGIIPFIIVFLILFRIGNLKIPIVNFLLFFFLIASINIDTLVSHNAIFFLVVVLFVSVKKEPNQLSRNIL